MQEKKLKGLNNVLHSRQEHVIDGNTSELLSTTTYTVKVQSKNPEDFGFLYRSGMEKAVACSGVAAKAYLWCLVNAQVGKGTVSMLAGEKKQMLALLRCSASAVQKALAELLAAGLLERVAGGHYALVMQHGWRGKAGGRKYEKEKKTYGPPPGFDN